MAFPYEHERVQHVPRRQIWSPGFEEIPEEYFEHQQSRRLDGQGLHAGYAATKGAVNALAKSMARDYAHLGIRVNAVAPAGVWTPMLKQWATEQSDNRAIETYH